MRRLLTVALISATAVAAGCGDDDGEAADGGGELTVSAASSLTAAFEAYGGALDGEERFSFAGSDDLAAQIRQGAPADLFASANTSLPDELFEEGLVEKPVVFARNTLVVGVPAGSQIDAIADLAKPGTDVVIGAEGVPIGDYTREVLARLPDGQGDAILANVRSEEPEVKGIVGKLATGAADAGLVYTTDVAATGGELAEIELPPDAQPEVAYGVAVVTDAANAEGAQAFIDGLLDGAGADALADAGFLAPEG